MPRPQFRLSTLLWITLAVACFFGGREFHRRWETPRPPSVLHEWIINGVPESSLPGPVLDSSHAGDEELGGPAVGPTDIQDSAE
jgi:hypothetical protein